MIVRNKFTGDIGITRRVYFEQYPHNTYHEHCKDLTDYGYPPAMLIPMVDIKLPTCSISVAATSFTYYFST